jgi:hypothetical protein
MLEQAKALRMLANMLVNACENKDIKSANRYVKAMGDIMNKIVMALMEGGK